jgi:hypothetical protein
MESLAIATCKSFTVPITPRLFIDLPGDNLTRGLSNVPLWPGTCGHNGREELQARIFSTTREKISTAQSLAAFKTTEDSDAEGGDNGCVVQLAPAETGIDDDGDDDDTPIVDTGIFPWSSCELLFREYLNMWKPTLCVTTYLGNGQEVVAHVRSKVNLVAFGCTAQHITFCKDPGAGVSVRFHTVRGDCGSQPQSNRSVARLARVPPGVRRRDHHLRAVEQCRRRVPEPPLRDPRRLAWGHQRSEVLRSEMVPQRLGR